MIGTAFAAGCGLVAGGLRYWDYIATPPVEVEKASLDLGTVPFPEGRVAKIRLHNRSARPLKIAKVASSCGCTVPRSPDVVAPSSPFEVSVEYSPSSGGHPIHEEIRLTFEGYERVPLVLDVTGKVARIR